MATIQSGSNSRMAAAPLHHSLHRGIGLHVFKQAHFHAGLLQVAHYLVQKAEALHAAAANNDDGLFAFQVGQLRQ